LPFTFCAGAFMSEKLFAVGSVAAALIWGTFFYPPPAPQRAQQGIKPRPAARPLPAEGKTEQRWWRSKLAGMKTPAVAAP
jgi:hypothetical protein